jgi:hypothetical protein
MTTWSETGDAISIPLIARGDDLPNDRLGFREIVVPQFASNTQQAIKMGEPSVTLRRLLGKCNVKKLTPPLSDPFWQRSEGGPANSNPPRKENISSNFPGEPAKPLSPRHPAKWPS